MKKILREDELRKEYDVYRLRVIAFNGKYLLDQFKTIESGRLWLIDEVNPFRLENETTDGIVLPVRLRD